ncbi:MAG: M48 family metalloprotease [Micromonosporaceae bacterium]|nr:M48 family metalloprotease [Micromonosporaceae bacterium]
MIVAAVLAGYAALAATLGAAALRRAAWPQRAPALGVAAWQALSISSVLAVVLAGLALAVPTNVVAAGLAELLQACLWALRAEYGPIGGPLLGAVGVTVAAGVTGRATALIVRELAGAARRRRRHQALLALVARHDSRLGALVVPHQVAAAYCLPGGCRQVVLTSAALAALDDEQLASVLAHEHAHLRGRHHLAVGAATGLRRAFPGVPVFRHAAEQIAGLIEMLADDAAVAHADRHSHAAALVALAEGAAPSPALAAGGPQALARVRRLLAPHQPLGVLHRAAAALVVVVLVALPIAVAIAPALVAAQSPYCPVDLTALS